MFDLISISLRDFRSYSGLHTFTFPQTPGLYYVTGVNKDNSQLGSNGSGKSSLIDAIDWCLFGKTTRGLKAGDVVNRHASGCTVTVEVQIGIDVYQVTRSQSPNNLTLDEQVIDQIGLEKLLRLNQESFHYSVIMPQFGTAFFDLQPAQKLTLFSEIMGLDYWLTKAKQADKVVQNVHNDLVNLEAKIKYLHTSLGTLKYDVDRLVNSIRNFQAGVLSKVKELESQRPKLLDDRIRWHTKLVTASSNVKVLKSEIKQLNEAENQLLAEREKVVKHQQDIRVQIAGLNDKLLDEQAQLQEIKALGPVCPACRQKVDAKHLAKHIKVHELHIKEWSSDLTNHTKELTKIKTQLAEFDEDHTQLKSIRAHKNGQLDDQLDEQSEFTYKIQTTEKAIDDLEITIAECKHQSNPFSTMLKEKKAALKKAETELATDEQELKEQTELHTAVSYWPSGFKQIRLFVIEEALRGFEVEINNSLVSLGLSDLEITLDVERENKSGGVTKGFSVLIKPPDYDKPIRFESWSGGETQRLCLAGDLGLSNLIMERTGLVNGIEFYDEPSQHLSPEGLQDLVETLYERAINSNKKIYLIDHSVYETDHFAGILTVTKDEQGSTLRFENLET